MALVGKDLLLSRIDVHEYTNAAPLGHDSPGSAPNKKGPACNHDGVLRVGLLEDCGDGMPHHCLRSFYFSGAQWPRWDMATGELAAYDWIHRDSPVIAYKHL
eukprot:scaffold154931_cov35-Prasinocladus_malaysianus.AAC.1